MSLPFIHAVAVQPQTLPEHFTSATGELKLPDGPVLYAGPPRVGEVPEGIELSNVPPRSGFPFASARLQDFLISHVETAQPEPPIDDESMLAVLLEDARSVTSATVEFANAVAPEWAAISGLCRRTKIFVELLRFNAQERRIGAAAAVDLLVETGIDLGPLGSVEALYSYVESLPVVWSGESGTRLATETLAAREEHERESELARIEAEERRTRRERTCKSANRIVVQCEISNEAVGAHPPVPPSYEREAKRSRMIFTLFEREEFPFSLPSSATILPEFGQLLGTDSTIDASDLELEQTHRFFGANRYLLEAIYRARAGTFDPRPIQSFVDGRSTDWPWTHELARRVIAKFGPCACDSRDPSVSQAREILRNVLVRGLQIYPDLASGLLQDSGFAWTSASDLERELLEVAEARSKRVLCGAGESMTTAGRSAFYGRLRSPLVDPWRERLEQLVSSLGPGEELTNAKIESELQAAGLLVDQLSTPDAKRIKAILEPMGFRKTLGGPRKGPRYRVWRKA